MTEKPLTVVALADLLEVSVDWVYTQVEGGAIPHTRLPGGRAIRFTAAQVAEIFAQGERPAVTVPPISLARARAIRGQRAGNPQPAPAPAPRPTQPVTPPKPAPATPRPPSRPGRFSATA